MEKLRVFCASIATETNTFSPLRTDFVNFTECFYAEPGCHPKTPTLCSAIFPCLRRKKEKNEIILVEGTATWAEPGGLINKKTWSHLKSEVLGQLKNAMPLDAVVLGLHGAMIAENCTDCEGELIHEIRKIIGNKAKIGVTFDPHSHLSDKRVKHADIITVFKEFPHTDFVETAQLCVDLTLKAARGKIKPEIKVFDVKMIDVFPTNLQPMRNFVDKMKKLEKQKDILCVCAIHGFMAGDSPNLGAKIIVITDDDKEYARELAQKMGMEMFSFRNKTAPEFLSVNNTFKKIKTIKNNKKPIVIADVWDNPGGGVAGDSTIIINKARELGLKNIAVGTIWDPMAVRICHAAGKDAEFKLRFGGKTSDKAGKPIDAKVKVKQIKRNATQSFGSSIVPLGDSAVIECDGMEIVLNSNRSQAFSPDLFTNLNINIKKKNILIVKSTNHFHRAFEPVSSHIIYTSVNGPYPNNPKKNKYKKLKRQIWPIVNNPHKGKNNEN